MKLIIDLFIIALVVFTILLCVKVGLNGIADHQGRTEGQYRSQYEVVNQQ